MKNSFKDFYKSKTETPTEPVYWDVVLFTGDYNPICREEFHRINSFVNKFITGNREKFSESIDIGLLTSEDSLSDVKSKSKCELTFDERQYISGKFFGLKMFPINFTELFSLAHFDKDSKLNKSVKTLSKLFREQFNNSNILIVLRPQESVFDEEIKEIAHVFTENNINVGFIVYDHPPLEKEEYLKKIPINGAMIKACCLMDANRPDPLEIKNFVYKYNLQEYLDAIKLMHFKTKNEKYDMVFNYLCPTIRLHNRKTEEQNYEFHTLMELIKKMYMFKEN